MPANITDRYRWLIKRFEQEFGKKNVVHAEFDWGTAFGIGAKNGDRRHAVKVEFYERLPGDKKLNLNKCKFYSLNDDPDKEKKVENFIKKIKRIF